MRMWPSLHDVNVDGSFSVQTVAGEKTIRVLSVEENYESDYWCKGNEKRRSLREARIAVEVAGTRGTVRLRPYEMPTVINGVQLYGELTRNWAMDCTYSKIEDLKADVRLSALDATLP